MKVYFSKTQHITLDHWEVTIAPACIRKGYKPEMGDGFYDDEFAGMINDQPKNGVATVIAFKGHPSVGRGYKLEKI